MTDRTALPSKCFVDSNVWLYALTKAQDALKHAIANQLLRSTGFVISTQVINEVCRNLIKKASFSNVQIRGVVNAFYRRCSVTHFDQKNLLSAITIREKHKISFWDSLIVASAVSADVELLYSEDLSTGHKACRIGRKGVS